MRQKDGNITADREEILDVCTEFYQVLHISKKEGGKKSSITSVDDTELPSITVRDAEVAVKQMKDNKAPGNDDLSNDIFKTGGDEINKQLVYNPILRKIPVKWKEAKIILLHKKADIKNYRPTSLSSHAYKIFTRIIQNRIKRVLDDNQPREQAGFREGFPTTDHLHALNQLIEKANEYQLKLCV